MASFLESFQLRHFGEDFWNISIEVPCDEDLETFGLAMKKKPLGYESYKRTVTSSAKFLANFVLRHFEVEAFCRS